MPLLAVMNELPATNRPSFEVTAFCRAEKARTEEVFARAVALSSAESWRPARHVFRIFVRRVKRHIRVAEEVLFPLFEVKTGGRTGLTLELVGDHRAMKQGLDELEACLREQRLDQLPACVRSLRDVASEHDGRELRLLCPLIDRLLSDAEREFLGARLRVAERSPLPSTRSRSRSGRRRSAKRASRGGRK
jgi:hypothetical protein